VTTTLSRRRFLGTTLAAGAAATLAPRVAWASPTDPATGDTIVWIFLRGGMDGLSMVVPYADSRYYSLRPTIAVPAPNTVDRTQGALPLAGGFGLHPAMTALYDGPWTAGRMAVVHAVGLSTTANRSHFEAQRFWDAGGPTVAGTDGGWLGRYLEAVGATGTVPAVGRTTNLPYSLWGHPEALAISDVTTFGLDDFPSAYRSSASAALDAMYAGGTGDLLADTADHTLGVYRTVQQANVTAIPVAAAYPSHWSAGAWIQTAQLLKSGLGVRAVAMDVGSWDHHTDQGTFSTGQFRDQAWMLSANLAAFVADLGSLLSEVTIVVVSEFGRTIDENGDRGTDHGRGSCMLVLGGSVVGGVYAADRFPGVVQDPTHGDLGVTTDVRTVLAEILRKRSDLPGVDLARVFPGWTHDPAAELGLVT